MPSEQCRQSQSKDCAPALEGLTEGLYPRSIERGPVEAGLAVSTSASPFAIIRAQLSVAPLKPGFAGAIVRDSSDYPRSIERGPVEAAHFRHIPATLLAVIRAQLSVAPLKLLRGFSK